MTTIVLAHGVLGFGVLGPLEYFNGVARHIEKTFSGIKVVTTHVNPIGSIAKRADELAKAIMHAAGGGKVHIVAHSMGGLDARYAIAHDRFDVTRHVGKLATIGTPHLGSPVADGLAHGSVGGGLLPIEAELRFNQEALHDLTTAVAVAFDRATDAKVPILCVAGDMTGDGAHASHVFKAIADKFGLSGPHDGVVTLHSATAGGKFELIGDPWPTDHAGEIGWNLDLPVPAAVPFSDHMHFGRYEEVVRALLR
jgi:triacylglycerol lipase